MYFRKILYMTPMFLLLTCNPPEFYNACDPKKQTFLRIYLVKQVTNDKTSFCGLGNSSINNSNSPSSTSTQTPSISYSGAPFTFVALSSVGSILPTIVGTFTSFSISPSLPSGLSFNSLTGEISGTPTFAFFSGSYVVTATGVSGAQTTNFTLSVILPGKRIFLTTATTAGNWGSIAGGDTFCNSDAGKPTGVGIYKAMVGSSGRKACNNAGGCIGFTAESIDWVLAAGIKYYRPDGTFIAQANSDRIFTFPLTNSISTISTNVWTGIDAGWNTTTASTAECTGWTNAGFGNYGTSNGTDSSILYVSNSACGTVYRLYCVEQ